MYSNNDDFFNYLLQFNYEEQEFYNYDRMVKNPNRKFSLVASADEINELYQSCLNLHFRKIEYNPSGSIKKIFSHALGAYNCDVVKNSANNVLKGIILTIIMRNHIFIFKYGYLQANKDSTMTGIKAFKKFLNVCEKLNIDTSKYECSKEEGLAIKDEIESPICYNDVLYKKIEHVNHLDLHRAWPSSTCDAFPELNEVYKKLHDKTIIDPLNGYFQSEKCNYKYAILAKAGVNGCNAIVRKLADNLEEQDFEVLGINTDGIWYRDRLKKNRLYHDENEGPSMHQWENDHIDCIWYARSDSQYYFIENGKFNVKAKGFYQYENKKPRDEWNEYDFHLAMHSLVTFTWDDNYGLIVHGGEQ